jgi:hypothetical protein
MQVIPVTAVHRGFGTTSRRDNWWAAPLGVFFGLSVCLTYMTWAAFQGEYFESGPYLSPLYAPVLWGDSPHAWFGTSPPWWPGIIPFSPALLILPFPGVFRFTCYYYRGAYYKAFWADPPSCAVGEPRKSYLGENSFPLIIQNIHRYFFYFALLVAGVLTYDAFLAFHGEDGGFGIGLGTVVLWVNVVLIWGYTLGCHSCRSITGGRLNHFSRHPVRYWVWGQVSKLNARHQHLAWYSLFSVLAADFYVLLVASGTIDDLRFYN